MPIGSSWLCGHDSNYTLSASFLYKPFFFLIKQTISPHDKYQTFLGDISYTINSCKLFRC